MDTYSESVPYETKESQLDSLTTVLCSTYSESVTYETEGLDYTSIQYNYLQILPCVQNILRASHIGMHTI